MEPLYTVFLTDRDGGEAGYEEFDTVSELMREWPYATRDSQYEFTADSGGRR